ncbi:MAG TPA: amino-acid N-acetyltransferase [Salinisphaeraceae bacterium]|nr:amino-acid N-acetyltransferase [Salinisphaeraceae bacterium]
MHDPEHDSTAIPSAYQAEPLVAALRTSAPYIHAHRGRTFVIHLPGEASHTATFTDLIYDIALLRSLGVRLVIVFGARPQIAAALAAAGIDTPFVNSVRVTSSAALPCIKQAVGSLQMDIEARLSTSLARTPMAGAHIQTVSGNLVTAKPLGVVAGVDHGHSGEVRRIDSQVIHAHLQRGHIVLLSCIGYSPSGEIFNLFTEEVASAAATALNADKLILLHAGSALHRQTSAIPAQLHLHAARQLLETSEPGLTAARRALLQTALSACRRGVSRAHLVSFEADGALLRELYSRDGDGTLIAGDIYDALRAATADDIGGILALTEPLQAAGLLIPRSREQLELDISHYLVMERDGMVTACCALFPYVQERMGELACIAVHPDYRNQNRAARLLAETEQRARASGLRQLFALTTRAPHWFVEHGFEPAGPERLPQAKRTLYNRQRNSNVFMKAL